MQVPVRRAPSAAFLFCLFCFVLPFVTFSCPGGSVTFSGLQLATGTTISEPQAFGAARERKLAPEPLALAALLCAVGGLFATFVVGRVGSLVGGAIGSLGALLLLFLKNKLESQALQEGGRMLQVSYDLGFWLSFLSFCIAAALAILILRSSPREELALAAALPVEQDSFFKEKGASR